VRVQRLQLPQILFVHMADGTGLDALQELSEPVTFLVPILSSHETLLM
jgi:hypothetical protein